MGFFNLLDPFINLTFSSMRQSSLLRKTILNRHGGEYSSDTCKLAQKNKETKTATTILVSPCSPLHPPPPKNSGRSHKDVRVRRTCGRVLIFITC